MDARELDEIVLALRERAEEDGYYSFYMKVAAALVAMKARAEKAEAERDENKADAEQWRAYKARKDRVIAAGMGRSPLRAAHPKEGA